MTKQIVLLENLIEEYAWVDKLLEEKYNLYALTEENIDDFIDAGLLVERYSDMDKKLEESTTVSNYSSVSNISNPFCSIEVEQIFNSFPKLDFNLVSESESEVLSELSSSDYSDNLFLDSSSKNTSSNNSIFNELAEAYDSDEYYQRLGDNNRLFCFN